MFAGILFAICLLISNILATKIILIGMIFTQSIIKTVYEIVILPITILIVKWVKKVEGTDTYDDSISYNPFSINLI